MSRSSNKHAIAKIVASERAEARQYDEWGDRHAIRTDIVPKPPRLRREAMPTPDVDDPTTRMAPERVRALLKAQDACPEPLEPTPGHSPTRVLDPSEVVNAQARQPEPRRPFEVVESVPARPPRAPKVPSDFATLPAEKTPTEKTPAKATYRERFTGFGGLLLIAVVVFGLTFGITKAARDERVLARIGKAVIESYDRAAAHVDAWFGASAEPSTAPEAPTPAAPAPRAAPPAPLRAAPPPDDAAPPVVRLEDLKLLEDDSAERARPPAPSKSAR